MLPGRDTKLGTVVGGVVFAIAIIGTVFLDWTWANTEGKLLPVVIGGAAAVVAVLVLITRFARMRPQVIGERSSRRTSS